jgi:hypothetical protein
VIFIDNKKIAGQSNFYGVCAFPFKLELL